MGKPSMFSSNYKQQLKKRRINTILFVLLIICIAFFGGKYYLNKNNISVVNSFKNIKIVQKINNLNLWSKFRNTFVKKKTQAENKDKKNAANKSAPPAAAQSSIPASIQKKIFEYQYTSKSGQKFYVEYEKPEAKVIIDGLADSTKTSDFSISTDKSMIVFDVKADNSIILCNSEGAFKEISRTYYKMVSTGKILTKESVLSEHKDYIWAAKPYFTLDGRVVYVSRLPYVRSDNTLYLWSVNIDGTNHKKISIMNNNIGSLHYSGYDEKGRLLVNFNGSNYYIDNGSYMLRKQ